MKRSVYSPISASMRCSSRDVPSVATTSACVSPRAWLGVVHARQHARANRNRTDRARVATVDTRFAVQYLAAHDLRLERETDFLDCVAVGAAFLSLIHIS